MAEVLSDLFASKARIDHVYISIDVEAAATGKGHNDRAPCYIAVVNDKEDCLLNVVVQVPNMFSPLTAITGLTKAEIDAGCPLAEAVDEVRKLLGPETVLVGQRPEGDIEWLGLKEGVDFSHSVDIGTAFRTRNVRYGDWNWFSLRHEAFGLLDLSMSAGAHSPVEDAQVSMQLFNRFIRDDHTGSKARLAGEKLTKMRYKKMFSGLTKIGNIDGVCGNKFNRKECICGQP